MKYAAWNLKSGPKLGSISIISLSVDGASMIIYFRESLGAITHLTKGWLKAGGYPKAGGWPKARNTLLGIMG